MQKLLLLFITISLLSGCKTWDLVRTYIPNREVVPVQLTSDEVLASIEASAQLRVEQIPDKVDITCVFDCGHVMKFQIRNVGDAWVHGSLQYPDGRVEGFDANWQLRHGILRTMDELDARQLGANQLRRGQPSMPIIPIDGTFYWLTDGDKVMYEVNNASVYAIRVVNRLKGEFGITGEMINASGVVRKYL